jgi:hypothetical protein
MFPIRTVLFSIAAAAILGPLLAPPAAAIDRQPPSCAAIAFRPVATGGNDGEQEAGLYKSRFGRIVVKAAIKGGAAQNYFVEINGKPLGRAPANLPQSVADCAKAKRLGAPAKALDTCTGDRLTVLIDHSGEQRYILLYAHSGNAWRFCSAGTA